MTAATDGASALGLVPRPRETAIAAGLFELGDATVLDTDAESAGAAAWLRGALGAATGFALRDGRAAGDAIVIRANADEMGPEGYRLSVSAAGVSIEAGGAAGAFYGAQTLRSLLPADGYRSSQIHDGPWLLPYATITDRPRFGWRGALLDVARHFLPKQDLLRFIDLIALHKLNTLHLHLTDDQGWRVEILRYPLLTEVGAWRRESPLGDRRHGLFDGRPHGGYYTQDDLREIVAYAADRHVTVIPEIDVPGHARAAIAAYPELGNTDVPGRTAGPGAATGWGVFEDILNAEHATLEFMYGVFDEVMDLFPATHIGIGGDECPTAQWQASPRARARMAELGLAEPDDIRTWYVARLGEHLAARGRSLYGWDEICDGELPQGAVVASWRGTGGAVTAARRGHDVVLCPENQVYFDYRQAEDPREPIPVGTVSDLEHVYAFDPVPAELTAREATRVLGAQCNIWTEHMDSARAVDYMVFPRLCAFAESVWSGPARDYGDFVHRMAAHEQRLGALGVEYRRAGGPQPWQIRPDAPGMPR
jgi:hexosaminidase